MMMERKTAGADKIYDGVRFHLNNNKSNISSVGSWKIDIVLIFQNVKAFNAGSTTCNWGSKGEVSDAKCKSGSNCGELHAADLG